MNQRRGGSVERARTVIGLAIPLAWLAMGPLPRGGAGEFESRGRKYGVETFSPKPGGGKHPVVLIVHGSAGLRAPFGGQFRELAGRLADEGFLVAIPSYFADGDPAEAARKGPEVHLQTLTDAVEYALKLPGADGS